MFGVENVRGIGPGRSDNTTAQFKLIKNSYF